MTFFRFSRGQFSFWVIFGIWTAATNYGKVAKSLRGIRRFLAPDAFCPLKPKAIRCVIVSDASWGYLPAKTIYRKVAFRLLNSSVGGKKAIRRPLCFPTSAGNKRRFTYKSDYDWVLKQFCCIFRSRY